MFAHKQNKQKILKVLILIGIKRVIIPLFTRLNMLKITIIFSKYIIQTTQWINQLNCSRFSSLCPKGVENRIPSRLCQRDVRLIPVAKTGAGRIRISKQQINKNATGITFGKWHGINRINRNIDTNASNYLVLKYS